jgi:MFS family permease
MNKKASHAIRPLLVWAFIEALIFWYAIEKVLWSSVGITAEEIIILGLLAQSSQVLIEVPSSIVADRWSRRKTLIAASLFMLISIIIILSTQSFTAIALMSIVWAFYYAFQSGTVNAYIYDLLKEVGEQAQYRKAVSRYATLQLAGLLVSSVGASLLVKIGNLYTPYWATILPTIIAIGILLTMHDPKVERSEKSTGTAISHVRHAAAEVIKKRWLSIVFISLSFVMAGRFIWYEYYQLTALDREVPVVLFGTMLALIHVGNIAGAEFAHRIKNPNTILLVSSVLLIGTSTGLAFLSGTTGILLALMACFFGSQAATIVLDETIQHQTSSELRATTLSLMGLGSRIVFGIGALTIILSGANSTFIALVAVVTFACGLIYIPARKYLYKTTI